MQWNDCGFSSTESTRTSRREGGVEGLGENRGGVKAGGEEVDDLTQGMNARIGPTAGVGRGQGAGQGRDRLFEHLLNGAAIGLALPAGEIRAVVGDHQLDVAHDVQDSITNRRQVPARSIAIRPGLAVEGSTG